MKITPLKVLLIDADKTLCLSVAFPVYRNCPSTGFKSFRWGRKSGNQYGGYDPWLVAKWVQAPNPESSGKEVGISLVMDYRLEWKAAHLFCSMLGSSLLTTRGCGHHLVDGFLESEDIHRMDWLVKSPDLISVEHAWEGSSNSQFPSKNHPRFENNVAQRGELTGTGT
ncbi:hypothetical protein TNCV_2210641 [Trichonephila clavipes]|nr:hypothetical protein TNCV_2210641 [Trichonephila clavipes]